MLLEIGRTVPYQPIRKDAAGVPDYALPLTLECRQETDDCWTGECRETGTATFAATADQVLAELAANVLLQLSELEAMGQLPASLEKWGIAPLPLRESASPAPAGPGSIAAPPEK